MSNCLTQQVFSHKMLCFLVKESYSSRSFKGWFYSMYPAKQWAMLYHWTWHIICCTKVIQRQNQILLNGSVLYSDAIWMHLPKYWYHFERQGPIFFINLFFLNEVSDLDFFVCLHQMWEINNIKEGRFCLYLLSTVFRVKLWIFISYNKLSDVSTHNFQSLSTIQWIHLTVTFHDFIDSDLVSKHLY